MEKQKIQISRRKFIQQTATGALAISAPGLLSSCSSPQKLPTRILGKTGLNVSMLSFGGGSQFLLNKNGEWEPMLERAVEMGINFFDTAPDYKYKSNMTSEEMYGEILTKYRDKIILSTKVDKPDIDEGMREFEESLKKMKTDYVDVLFLHAVGDKPNTLDIIEKEKTYSLLARLKQEGSVKYIGFSSMTHATEAEEILKRYEFDVAMLAYNPVGVAAKVYGEKVIPLAHKQNAGVLTIKVMRGIVGKNASAKELLQYSLTTEGVNSALISYHGMDIMEENVRLAHEIASGDMIKIDNEELEDRVAHLGTSQHLPYLDPYYVDGNFV